MFCSQCGAEIRDGAAFCIQCGTMTGAQVPVPQMHALTLGCTFSMPDCRSSRRIFWKAL